MLKSRIIPTLLWKNLGLVKGVSFDSWRRIGPLLPAIKVYNQREVDELIFLDISATGEQREPDYESVKEISSNCFVPLTVGGGIWELNQVNKILRAGADKICINSAAYTKPGLVTEISKKYGNQCVVVSIDVRKKNNVYKCFSHNGKIETERTVLEHAREMESRGAGELMITSIEFDGTMKGYDLTLLKIVSSNIKIPVIASGGAGNYQHMLDAIVQGGASAVAAASMFHFTEKTPLEAKAELKKAKIPIREKML